VQTGARRIARAILPKKVRARIRRSRHERKRAQLLGLDVKGQRSSSREPNAPRIWGFGGFQVAYRQGTADEDVILHSFDRDIFFAGAPEYKPEENHLIVDVGAHIGTFSLLAAAKVKEGRVYAIEPCQDSFDLLRVNAVLNRATNILPFHLALSDEDGTTTLARGSDTWSHSTVGQSIDLKEEVDCLTLGSFLDRNEISACDFMKMNCEGAEFPILLTSSRDVLRRFAMILVLYHCDIWKGHREDSLLKHLELCGFSSSVRNQTTDRGWILATRQPGAQQPRVATPEL
jgi:FkbM family methyltransferase